MHVANLKPQVSHPTPTDLASSSTANDKKRKASTNVAAPFTSTSLGLVAPSPHSINTGPSSAGPSNATQSLFASILAPPPSKRARTIHNPEAPLIQPGESLTNTTTKPNKRSQKKAPSKKGKEVAKATKADVKKSKSRAKAAGRAPSQDSTRTSQTIFSGDPENVNDSDLKAAATLTEIFFRGAGSPRSSFASTSQGQSLPNSQSSVGSRVSHSQKSSISSIQVGSGTNTSNQISHASQGASHSRTQSGASTVSVGLGSAEQLHTGIQGGNMEAADVNMEEVGERRSLTPTAARPSEGSGKGQAADSEAADLMLLLANSPSPRRPAPSRDKDIVRNVYAAGRVLFPSSSQQSSGSTLVEMESSREGRALARTLGSSGGSFSSVFGSDNRTVDECEQGSPGKDKDSGSGQSKEIVPILTKQLTSTEPIVTPPSPTGPSVANAAAKDRITPPSLGFLPAPLSPSRQAAASGPLTPNPSFNLSDYINVSPSPGMQPSQTAYANANAATSVPSRFPKSGPPASMSAAAMARHQAVVSSPLRKSFDGSSFSVGVPPAFGVGRRLFDGDAGGAAVAGGAAGNGAPGVRHPASLGSGIDLQG